MRTAQQWASWAAGETQRLHWDVTVIERMHDAETTGNPYPTFTVAERDLMDEIHEQALGEQP